MKALKADTLIDEVGLGLVIDAERFRLESISRWLDAADDRRHVGTTHVRSSVHRRHRRRRGWARTRGPLVPVPLTHLIALLVGIPVVATGAAWLLAGHRPTRLARPLTG